MQPGEGFKAVEISTVHNALLWAGARFAPSYFDRDDEPEGALRAAVDEM
jgi:hypothetical protein